MKSSKKYLPTLSLLFGAICWGIIWYPYRLLEMQGIVGMASSLYTYSIAAIFGSLLFVRSWKGLFKSPSSSFLLGVAAGWTNLSYVLAVINGEVMRVMFLFYLSPLWTLLLAHYWLKEPFSKRGVMTIVISLIGAFIMLSGLFNGHNIILPVPQSQSEWLALSAGIGFSFSNVITRRSIHLSLMEKSMAVWFGVAIMAFILMTTLHLTIPSPLMFKLNDLLLIGVISSVLIAVTVFVQYGVTRLSATRASVIFLFELVVASIASYYLAGERMQTHEWIGGAFIIAAALFASLDEQAI